MPHTRSLLSVLVLTCCTLLCLRIHTADGARILGVFTSTSKSHILIHAEVADALGRAGHNVTVIGNLPNVNPDGAYNYIQIGAGDYIDAKMLSEMVNKPLPVYRRFSYILQSLMSTANLTLQHPTMRKFLRTHGVGDFDLVVLGYYLNDFELGVAAHFRCPSIISLMIRPMNILNKLLGNPFEAAYVPTLMTTLRQPLGFMERLQNFLTTLLEENFFLPFFNYHMEKYYNYNFPPDRYPSLDEVRKNISLVFTNHHFSQGPIRPNVPNLIEIGGIQIKEKPDPLPADIAKVLDESKKGVIYFSLGSNIQGTHLTPEKAKIMFNVISKLPYEVLWKWGDSDFPGQSSNIIYKSWLPQDDILAHSNVKLFITHGGMGSVVESQYHGVPMVGIPLFAEQPANMANVERSGFGLSVDYVTLTEKSLGDAINEVLNNPKYGDAVRTFCRLYRDRPMTARQSVVYWTEYVLRHKGAKHIQSPAVHMNRWQLMSLDVIAFLLAIIASVVFVFVQLCRCICCRRKKVVQVTKAKKKK